MNIYLDDTEWHEIYDVYCYLIYLNYRLFIICTFMLTISYDSSKLNWSWYNWDLYDLIIDLTSKICNLIWNQQCVLTKSIIYAGLKFEPKHKVRLVLNILYFLRPSVFAMEKSAETQHPVKAFGWAAQDTSGLLSPFKFSRRYIFRYSLQ